MPETLTMRNSATNAQLTYKATGDFDVSFVDPSRISFWDEDEPYTTVEETNVLSDDAWNTSTGSFLILGSEFVYNRPHPTALLDEVDRAERWFRSNYAQLLPQFGGRYVAVHGDGVADSDTHLGALVDRFFKQWGEVAAYFGFVGDRPHAGLAADAG
jgi:hypothetical protein